MSPTRIALLSLFLMLAGCAEVAPPAPVKDKKEEAVPLTARLVANKDTYTLPTGGKTLEDYKKLVEAAGMQNGMPPAPAVDLVFEITNTGDKDLDVDMWGVGFQLSATGPGVVDRSMYSMNCIPPPSERIKAGETKKVAISALTFSTGKGTHTLYLTKAGEYEVSASYAVSAALAPAAPGTPKKAITLKGGPVKLKVVDGKEGTPVVPPGKVRGDAPALPATGVKEPPPAK
jgi:hypothetical protein